MSKAAVIGANGQLGADVIGAFRTAQWEPVSFTHSDFAVEDEEAVRSALAAAAPAVVVNTAAMHNVESCEADPAAAYRVNALGARNVARACRSSGAYLVHISTDYVFDGRKGTPYVEEDLPCPLNAYGNTKLAGEYYVLAECPGCAVVRTSGLYGRHPCRAKRYNFVELMLKLAEEKGRVRVVQDEVLTPTYTWDLARQIVRLGEERVPLGICHATNEGSCSWYDFAAAIFELAGVEVVLEPAGPGDFPGKVPRPKYSVLENRKLKERGLNVMRPWREALAEYLQLRASRGGGGQLG